MARKESTVPDCYMPDTSPETALLLRATLPPRLSMSRWNSSISLRTSGHSLCMSQTSYMGVDSPLFYGDIH